MDYTKESLAFKIRKGMRYIFLYGIGRTIIKVRSKYHMNRHYTQLPAIRKASNSNRHVGILGCGQFGYSNIAYYLRKNFGGVIRGVMDVNVDRAASMFQEFKTDYFTTDENDIIQDTGIDLIYVASNHYTHAEYAIRALRTGKSVHIEKPHAVTVDQLVRLVEAMKDSQGKVRLGFNRPHSYFGLKIREALAKETGPGMYNWFVAGHEIEPDHWYFSPAEGGRILGNLCHWTDFLLHLVPEEKAYPITIVPTRADRSDCDISISYIFGEGSIGTIAFSVKGHTFEGVRESFSGHKGNTLVDLRNFEYLRIDVVDQIYRKKLWARDHGHETNIVCAYSMLSSKDHIESQKIDYVWNSGYLALKTKEALERNEKITVEAFSKAYAMHSEYVRQGKS